MTALLAAGGPDAVAVVLVGDELLLGSVADTNGAWLARTLTSRGLRLVSVETVPDDTGRIAAAIRPHLGQIGSVVVAGGIGPTSDDLTREALAEVAGCPLVQDEPAARAIISAMSRLGRPVNPHVLRMARRPTCATMIVNPAGSAPGVRLEQSGTVVYATPGVPGELRSMMDVVLPEILTRAGALARLRSASIEVSLLGESSVAALLGEIEAAIADDPDTDLAYLARPARVSVRVSVRSPDETAERRLADWVGQITAALGDHVLGTDGTSLPDVVVALLRERGETVAAAESLTGGSVMRELTDVPGCSAVVRGGVTVYATDLKTALLGVPSDLLDERGPVDADVAAAMAIGVRTALGATWGVATTGVAGPDPVDSHPPGEVHLAVAGPDGVQARSLHLPGDRLRVRTLASAGVLDGLRRLLSGREWRAARGR